MWKYILCIFSFFPILLVKHWTLKNGYVMIDFNKSTYLSHVFNVSWLLIIKLYISYFSDL